MMGIIPRQRGGLEAVSAFGLLLAFHLLSAVAVASEERIDQCGAYRLKEEHLTVGFTDDDKQPLNIIRVYDFEERLVKVFAYRQLTVQGCQDITADGVPELLLEGYSGGDHCCWISALYSMGTKIENRLIFRGSSGRIDSEDIKNLDQGPAHEIRARDGSLSYFGGLSYFDSPSLPLILCYRGGRYNDCTQDFPELLDQEIQETEAKLEGEIRFLALAELNPSAVERLRASIKGLALRLYALHILAGEETRGWDKLRQILSDEDVLLWLEEHKDQVSKSIKEGRASSIKYQQ